MPIPIIRKKYPKGPSGVAIIRKRGNKILIEMPGEDDSFEFATQDFEEQVGKVVTGQFFVQLDSKGDNIMSVRPPVGAYTVKVDRFASSKDQPPKPFVVPSKQGRKNDGTVFTVPEKHKFTVIFKIVEGPLEGLEIPDYFEYRFNKVADGSDTTGVNWGTGRDAEKLLKFLEYTGAFDQPIPFSDNVLPALEEIILRNDKPFMVILNNGFVDSYTQAVSFASEEEEAPKPKARSRKSK